MSLVNRAIELLRREILETEEQNLPPLRVLSGKYGISLVVVRDAALELRLQGLLRFSRGTKLRIIRQGDTNATVPRRISAAQRIYEHLRDSIRKGEYRTGDPLPKQGYIAAHMHVSTRTVTAAYSRLIEERLAHRRGKTRIAGPAAPHISRSRHPPALLVVVRHSYSWSGLCSSLPLSDFGRTFEDEAQKSDIALVRYCTSQPDPPVSEIINSLGTRYVGALIAGTVSEIPDISIWAETLVSFGKPVVWFDRNEDGCSPEIQSSLFTRVTKSERLAVKAEIDYLANMGHRYIAYYSYRMSDWRIRRFELIKSLATELEIKVAQCKRYPLELIKAGDPFFECIDRLRVAATPEVKRAIASIENNADLARIEISDEQKRLSGHALAPFLAFSLGCWTKEIVPGPECRYLEDARVVWSAMELSPLFENPPATALIAANDLIGRSTLFMLARIGLNVPARISLVSFDNAQRFAFSKLTSVDFGFSYLGYQAFHALIGDIPIDRSREGLIIAPAKVIEKGSSGSAGNAS